MTFAAHVNGGTGAGRKRPLQPASTIPWHCSCCIHPKREGGICLKTNPGYLKRCIDCGTSRDPS